MIVHQNDRILMPVLCMLHDWVAAQVQLSTVASQLLHDLTSWSEVTTREPGCSRLQMQAFHVRIAPRW